MYKTAVIT